jgi:hypothetical protein
MVLGLPGVAQLLPIVGVTASILVWRAWRERRRTIGLRQWAGVADAALALSLRRQEGTAEAVGAENGADGAASSEGASSAQGAVTVRQAPGVLAAGRSAAGAGGAVVAETIAPPWEAAILDAARRRGAELGGDALRGLGAVKAMLNMSQELAVFKHIRTIMLYGPLAHGEDPLREVNLLIICNPIKGPFGVERAFAEIDGLSQRVHEQTGVRLRPLIVVRGLPERTVPGEPSWRELARRGVVVYGADV